jgi:uncharacterized protein (DUF433 family)
MKRSASTQGRAARKDNRPLIPLCVDAQDRHARTRVSVTYVEQRDGVYMVSGTRVSLDSIAYAFLGGQSAESIAQAFPVLTLEQAYGAIAFYLAHRNDVDRYLEAERQDFESKRAAARAADPMFYQKLADARKRTPRIR